MMNQNRFCSQLGHELFEVSQICTNKQCATSRWCCSQCLDDSIHDHQKKNQYHIMNQGQLSARLKQDIEQLKSIYQNNQYAVQIESFLWQLLKEFQKLKQQIVVFEQNVEEQLNNFSSKDLQSLKKQLEGPKFTQIDDQALNKWLNNDYQQLNFNIQYVQDQLENIQQQLNRVVQRVVNYQENKSNIQDLSQRKYDILQVQGDKKIYCESAIISNNERYLVYNHINVIKIYDIKLNKMCRSIYQRNLVQHQFSFDSQYLFTGDHQGFVCGFLAQNNFKKFYKQQIHQDQILKMKLIQKQIITCIWDERKKQTLKLVGHFNQISSIDYDHQKGILISVSTERNIKIWDCYKQSILIDYKGCFNFKQVQFANNSLNILSLDSQGNLLKFRIDYENKQLIYLDEYKDCNKIFGFQQVNNQNLLLICQQYCRILNNEGELISTIYHYLQFQPHQIYGDLLDNLNHIVLYDEEKLYLAKALN